MGGAVGVEGELPALSVDADVVVELADQDEVAECGLAAVLLVSQVVDVAVGGGAAAPGPGARAVAEGDGAADVPGDAVAVADVERERRGVVGLVEEALAEGGGDAGGAGDEVEGEAGDGVAQRPRCLG